MKVEDFKQLLETHQEAFVQFEGQIDMTEGWKLSIQGKTIEDSLYLYRSLINLLIGTKVYFKFATKLLIDLKHPQQSHKLLTIYLPKDVDTKSFAELVYINLRQYVGHGGITPEGYTHYKSGIFYRNDRDANGKYIMPY